MGLLRDLKSIAKGTAWLVRAGGLREQMRTLQTVGEHQRRWQAGDLRAFERQESSQNGEDGILQELFRRIGVKHRLFVEFGVQSGVECNCARLVRAEDWGGIFMECSPSDFQKLQQNYRDKPKVRCLQVPVTSQNIESLLEGNQVPPDFDLLSIDIDGNDYWVWKAITRWQPRVVVIEYNAVYPPPIKWVMKENLEHRWDGTNYYGASLTSLTLLGRSKGYCLVGTDSRGVNAFFVRADLVDPEKFLDPALFYHYAPFNHPHVPGGHPQGYGPAEEI